MNIHSDLNQSIDPQKDYWMCEEHIGTYPLIRIPKKIGYCSFVGGVLRLQLNHSA